MAKTKDFTVSVPSDKVMYTNISKSKDGYNSARLVAKLGDNEYMAISYEWEGEGVPGFAMNLMGFMKANKVETSGIWPEQEESYEEFAAKAKPKSKKKDDMEEEEDGPPWMKKKKSKSKGAKKMKKEMPEEDMEEDEKKKKMKKGKKKEDC